MAVRVLIAEDDPHIVESLSFVLGREGFEVSAALDGEDALRRLQTELPDVVILDVMLPGRDGFDIVRNLRIERVTVPILMLTARSTELDRVLGLELGADDYLAKPFSVPELQARVKAMLRRIEMQAAERAAPPERLRFGELEIDTASREARLARRPLALTAKEFELLQHFARHPGRAFTRMQLLDAVWGTTFEGYEHNVNTHINRLRSKIEADPANPRYVLTVRGVGYRFTENGTPR